MRADGGSIKRIAADLAVSPSSVSRWTADIALGEEQVERLLRRDPSPGARARSTAARAVRAAAQRDGRERAARGDPLHHAGCMLYWAEGSKQRNGVVLTNSDADMLDLFVRFLRECYEVPAERINLTVNCHLNNGLSLQQIEAWWLERLGLMPGCLRKAAVNRPSSASRWRRNVHVHGTAQGRGAFHRDRAEHLRRDSAVRGHRAAGMAGLPHTIPSAPVAQSVRAADF